MTDEVRKQATPGPRHGSAMSDDYPQVTVSIGRNYGHGAISPVRHLPWFGKPMSAKAWRQYRADVYDVLAEHGSIVLATDGVSVWRDSENGICTETSYTVAATGIHPNYHVAIRKALRSACRRNQQDSIAITLADPSFLSQ